MIAILRGAEADPELIAACENFRCEDCASIEDPRGAGKAKAPSPYIFNHDLILDLFDIHDDDGATHAFLSIVCNGATSHVAAHARVGKSSPSSRKCS